MLHLRFAFFALAVLAACARLSAQIAPTVTQPPVSQLAAIGGTVTFSVTAAGTEPLTYQWIGSSGDIPGATARTLTLPSLKASDTGAYTVRVTNAAGSVTSRQANLNVLAIVATAPVFAGIGSSADSIPGAPQPISTGSVINTPPDVGYSAPIGARFLMSGTFTGALPMTLQWTRNNVPLAGQTTQALFLTNAQPSDTGVYRLVVTNSRGTATSLSFTITITPYSQPPFIETQPLTRRVDAGAPVSFNVVALGETPFTYEWQRDGVTLPGATTSALTFASASPADAALYRVRVTNRHGTTESFQVTLFVVTPVIAPVITAPPVNTTASTGTRAVLSVTATGTAPLTYQWYRNGELVFGAASPELVFPATRAFDAGTYTVTVTNSAGSVTSAPATLTLTTSSRISNLSVLTSLTEPADNFTLGYVVGGAGTSGSKPLVLRAAGPALAALGVGGTLDDPKLETFAGAAKTGENDNWAGLTSLISAFTSVGAFPFASPTSRDAAIATSLATRDNSVKISAATGGTGQVIAEIYDATPTVDFTAVTPRLLNVSVLKSLGTGLTVGFTIAGNASKTVLIRAIGPTLGDFGVPGTVADPRLTLVPAGTDLPFAINNDWAGTPALTAAFSAVGAFALPPTSKDAAILTTLAPGGYSVQVSGVNNTTGVALVEVYEVP